MKLLTKLTLAVLVLTSAITAQAQSVRGYARSYGTYVAPYRSGSLGGGYSSGYVYRNPYAASPSVHVQGYYRRSGTLVAPHYRTLPNYTRTDNLNYRGYGTIRVPRSWNGW